MFQATRVDKNRASPYAVTQLYASLTKDQRDAIVDMGQGSFLNIKCNSLHNPLNSWFVRCYDPKRRAFVVPCRGIIPLTEESVELLTGLPRGPLEVKYHVDGELEEQISSRLFPVKAVGRKYPMWRREFPNTRLRTRLSRSYGWFT